ncbi:MAG: hypothetical protein ABIJ18_00495 [archaeon]
MVKIKRGIKTGIIFLIIALILCITLVFADNLIVTPTAPANGTFWNGTCMNFTFTAVGNDTQFDNASLYIDRVFSGFVTNVINNTATTNLTNCSEDSIAEGGHSWYINVTEGSASVWANGSYVAGANTNMSFIVDRTLPIYDVGVFYTNQSQRKQNNIYVTINITEIYGANVTFTLFNISKDEQNNTVNRTVKTLNASAFQIVTMNWTDLSDGNYSYNVTVTDFAGNTNKTKELALRNGYLLSYMVIDTTAPVVNIVSPTASSTEEYDGVITFNYNFTDVNQVINCSLWLDGVHNATNTSIAQNVQYNISVVGLPLNSNAYSYYIKCEDNASNIGNSVTRYLDTYRDPAAGTGDSNVATGTTTTTSTTHDGGTIDAGGYSQSVAEGEKVTFELRDEDFKIRVDSVGTTTVDVYLYEADSTVTITKGMKKKVDLNGDGVYDAYISCVDIENGEATIQIDLYEASADTTPEVEEVAIPEEELPAAEVVEDEGGFFAGTPGEGWYMNAWNWVLIGLLVTGGVLAGLWYFVWRK